MDPEWKKGVSDDEASLWQSIFGLRDDVNKLLETARGAKVIGSSLDAQIVLVADNADTLRMLQELNNGDLDAVDELRYLFLVSQVRETKKKRGGVGGKGKEERKLMSTQGE